MPFVSVADDYSAAQTHIVEYDSSGKEILDHWDDPNREKVTVQCFPLYSILLAVNRTRIDFFSLDIEGHEFRVLKTIPSDRVDIRVLFSYFIS